ncbi:uncharacterized protein C7orf50 [Amyelois transitella]|uniref:uncharacterized protein C7orf50 n=1 Tax=Amyelois transitella TaxID=680683 RepID=UPI00067D36C7|nr:uncharacterized protein C7orf50 [Amyelois transitella]
MGGIKKKRNNRNNKKNKMKKANKLKAAYLASKGDNKNEDLNVEHQNEVELNPNKRYHEDNDSDNNEERPKKKKKKNSQAINQDSTDKKGKKSIRQIKREKYLQRQAEAELEAKDQLKLQCLTYLSQWKHDKANWKFMKAKQVWLYKNKFSSKLLPDESWPLLLEYFESSQGNIRNMLLEDANKIIKQMDDWTESQQNTRENDNTEEKADDDNVPELKKPDETSYKRARDLIQCLQ